MMKLLSFSVLLFFSSFLNVMPEPHYQLLKGELDGAPYTIALPNGWQGGDLFFHVHGWRPSDAPHEADLNPDDPFYQFLLLNGWAIARTAFSENGVDHDAHTADIDRLQRWIGDFIRATISL